LAQHQDKAQQTALGSAHGDLFVLRFESNSGKVYERNKKIHCTVNKSSIKPVLRYARTTNKTLKL
jgi:hypothetical protein